VQRTLPLLSIGRKEARIKKRLRKPADYTPRNSGTNSAGCLKTDSAWNMSLRENAVETAPN
jgi:hypothetical protein